MADTFMKKRYIFLLIIPLLLFGIFGCKIVYSGTEKTENLSIDESKINSQADIVLSKKSISSDNSSVSIDGTTATIINGGEYSISGILEDGQIIINAPDEDVNIVFDTVFITNTSGPAIYVIDAQDVHASFKENSTNILSDGYKYDELDIDDEPNAVIYSNSDIDFIGSVGASLEIIGNYKDGIATKDDLDITNLALKITAKDDGLHGKDSVEINGSTIEIISGGDAIKSDNKNSEKKGFITISDSSVLIDTGDDGIHAVNYVDILSGDIDILNSFEGIEGKVITIHGGEVDIVSQDDGINVSDSSSELKGEEIVLDAFVSILGGKITMNTGGDGFDSNGTAMMSGGTLIVNGPSEDRNGAIDVNGSFDISGGTLIAVGSSGMAEAPSDTSTQYVIQVNFDDSFQAGTKVSLENSLGQEIFSFIPEKTFQSVTYSSADLIQGETYTILVDRDEYTSLILDSVVTKYSENSQVMRRRMR